MNTKFLFEKILLGLPVPSGIPIAVHWTLTTQLRKLHKNVIEVHFFHIMLPLLLNRESYLTVINSRLLDLNDPANADRAILIRLANLFPKNTFIIWDQKRRWEGQTSIAPNLVIRKDKDSKELLKFLENFICKSSNATTFH